MAVFYPRATALIRVLLEDFDDGSNSNTHVFQVEPRSCSWERNSVREADTFSLELDFRELPLDPRVVRAIWVALYVADLGAPDTEIDLGDASQRVMVGYVDEPEVSLEESGETVSLTGRDYTSLFLDKSWSAGSIDITGSLRKVVSAILAQVPGAESIPVDLGSNGGVQLSTLTGRSLWAPEPDSDAWMVLSDLCGLVGLIPVVELDTLRIVDPAELGDRRAGFLYGRDLTRLVFRRAFNEARTAQVEVRAWDPAARVSRSARYPKSPIVLRKKITPSGEVKTDNAPLAVYSVTGGYSKAELEQLAERIYQDGAREQIEGSLETAELVDVEQGTALPQLANGDRVDVLLGTDLAGSIAEMSPSEAVAFLTSGPRPMAEAVARAFVDGFQRAERLASTFYVKRARHRWEVEQGYSLEVDFVNLVGAGGRT